MSQDNYNRGHGRVGGSSYRGNVRGGSGTIDDDDALSTTSLTYEQMMASTRESNLPDKVAWNSSTSYRNNPYRQLHHQRGIIGYIHVRLVEGRDLCNTSNPNSRRRKELLNPFVVLRLASAEKANSFESLNHDELNNIRFLSQHESSIDADLHAPDDNRNHHNHHEIHINQNTNNEDLVRSSSVIRSNNPSWSSSMTSSFRIPLRKGSLHPEGSPVFLYAHVRHDPNADPHGGGGGGIGLPIPSIFGIGGDQEDKRHVGYALVDVTSLLFGSDNILDVWAPLSRDFPTSAADVTYHNQVPEPVPKAKTGNLKDGDLGNNSTTSTRGSIRMLLSYSPNGMRPQPNDLVTFESFSRSPTNLLFCHAASSSHGTMTQPMKVLSLRGDYMLVQYNMLQEKKREVRMNSSSQRQQQRQQHLFNAHYSGDRKISSSIHGSTTSQSSHGSSPSREDSIRASYKSTPSRQQQQQQRRQPQQVVKYGKLRVHRNTVFVIERISFMDSTVNTVLTPVDIVSKLPLTQDVGRAVGPYVGAVGDLVMPALLSSKLLWAAARTTASAGITGVATAGKVLVLAAAAGKRDHDDPRNHR